MNRPNGNGGKVFTNVVYLMAQNPLTDRWEVMAYFPDISWDGSENMKASYMHNGQHGPCHDAFALLDCIAPKKCYENSVKKLHNELKEQGYILKVLDSQVWLDSKGRRKKELEINVHDALYQKDSALLMAGTEEKRAAIKAARSA